MENIYNDESIEEEPVYTDDIPKQSGLSRVSKYKKHIIILGVIIILVLAVLFLTRHFFIVATVNGGFISRRAFITALEKHQGKQVLAALIEQKIVNQELKKRNIQVTDEEVDIVINKIREQIEAEGGTLEEALSADAMTENDLRDQIRVQKQLETVLTDKVVVADEEINVYIAKNNITPTEEIGYDVFVREVRDHLKRQKFQLEAQKWIDTLTKKARIKYYTEY
jgi:parvulin-like peptidyl-prolyl isomerase